MKSNKKKKTSILNIIGIFLIIAGLGTIAYDFGSKYLEQRKIEETKQNFLDSMATDEVTENPTEGTIDDVWGLIKIDKIDVDNPISARGDFSLLYRYLVAFPQSTLPPNQGNFIVTGHNGDCANCGFRNLYRLENGDKIELRDRNNVYEYEVYDQFIIQKTETYVLDPIENETTLTLITCVRASSVDPERRVVRARLVSTKPIE